MDLRRSYNGALQRDLTMSHVNSSIRRMPIMNFAHEHKSSSTAGHLATPTIDSLAIDFGCVGHPI